MAAGSKCDTRIFSSLPAACCPLPANEYGRIYPSHFRFHRPVWADHFAFWRMVGGDDRQGNRSGGERVVFVVGGMSVVPREKSELGQVLPPLRAAARRGCAVQVIEREGRQ